MGQILHGSARTTEAVRRQLGIDGFARFLNVSRITTGDYTRDRHLWLDGVTIEEVLAELPPA